MTPIVSHIILFLSIIVIGTLYSLYPTIDRFQTMFGEFGPVPTHPPNYRVLPNGGSTLNYPGDLTTDIDRISLGNSPSNAVRVRQETYGSLGNSPSNAVRVRQETYGSLGNPYYPKTGATYDAPIIQQLPVVGSKIDELLNHYSETLHPIRLDDPNLHTQETTTLVYTPTNTPTVVRQNLSSVLQSLLHTVNIRYDTEFYLVNVDQLHVVYFGKPPILTLYKVSFYIHERRWKLSRKCIAELAVDQDNIVHAQSVSTISPMLPVLPIDHKKYIDNIAIQLKPTAEQVNPSDLFRQPTETTHHIDVNDYEKQLVRRPLLFQSDPLTEREGCKRLAQSFVRSNLS
jgi:hypothetical protein